MAAEPGIIRAPEALRTRTAQWRAAGETVGLVPTMGALHAGHLALVAAARAGCDRVVVSIFVNPKQFGPSEDFDAYPRQEAEDRAALAAYGVDAIYAPRGEAMYPPGFATQVAVGGGLTADLCAADRPGHFDGVTTVVTKLLLQAWPDRAYFGEKDFQQLQIVRRLALDLDLPVAIESGPVVRESDGLAVSSRNAYLDGASRARAGELYATLSAAAERLARGESVEATLAAARQDLAAVFDGVDYLAYRRSRDLARLDTAPPDEAARLLAAVRLDGTRLIDNMPVGERTP